MYRLDEPDGSLPIRRDPTSRGVTDPASRVEALEDWLPADRVTAKLWRCVEALRDINELLEFVSSAAGTKRRRRSRLLAIPLVSLATEARRLCNYYLTSPEWKDRLSSKQRTRVSEVLEILGIVPLGRQSKLREIRDRYSAHIDKDLLPDSARTIAGMLDLKEFAKWLHACIEAIRGLLDIYQYSWRTNDVPSGFYRFVSLDPWLFTWARNEEGAVELVNACICEPPRRLIMDLCEEVIGKSQVLLDEQDA